MVVLAAGAASAIAAIGTAQITNNSVASVDIRNESLTGVDIKNGTIASRDIGTGAVTAADLATGAVTSVDIASGAVTGTHVLDGSLGAADIADGSITGAKLAAGTVGNRELSSDLDVMRQLGSSSFSATMAPGLVGDTPTIGTLVQAAGSNTIVSASATVTASACPAATAGGGPLQLFDGATLVSTIPYTYPGQLAVGAVASGSTVLPATAVDRTLTAKANLFNCFSAGPTYHGFTLGIVVDRIGN
jgi:hypothetical protein